ncbi:MAG: AAA family ATPase [Lentisphaerae bacterium]|nr:AAA family ATPase [Lentisphaerota bacterium]
MKILKVRLKNLNSLVGEWNIDFTHPAYIGDGIFAITGPTGAGKSTILDAICLALFGQTPRLAGVNKSSNEIMSRHCGECEAEVEFSTSKGHYRCTWYQHRARGKADGNLQQQKHEIADLASGKVLETKLLAVVPKVEQVTGMNFERFTRSMLLAQGSFAAFLQADSEERACILEGLTGTGIYTEISKLVHERNRDEKEALERLKVELSGVLLLGAEEEQQLRNELAGNETAIADLEKSLAAVQTAIAWLQRQDELRKELAALEPQKKQLDADIAAFATEHERLAAALKALECEAEYSKVRQLRDDVKKKTDALATSNERLPKLREEASKAEAEATAATKRYDAGKNAQIELAPQLRQARDLDGKINTGKTLLTNTERRLAEITDGLNEQQKLLDDTGTTLADKTKLRAELEAALAARSTDGELVGRLAAIKDRFAQLRQARKDLDKATAEQRQAEEATQTAEKAVERGQKELARLQAASEAATAKLAKAEATLKDSLRERSQDDWQDQLRSLEGKLGQLQQAQDRHATYGSQLKKQAECRQECDSLQKSIAALTASLKAQNELCQTQAALVSALDEKLHAAELIADYEQARRELADGKPCPLCGATDHPFAKGNIPAPSAAKQELDVAKTKLAKSDKEKQRLEVELKSQQNEMARAEKELKQLAQELPAVITQLNGLCAKIAPGGSLKADTPMLGEKLTELTQDLESKRTEAARVVEQARKDAKAVEAQKKEAEKAVEAGRKAEASLKDAKADADNAKLNQQAKADACATAQGRLAANRQQALDGIRPFGYDDISGEELDDIAGKLQQRHDKWQELKQGKIKLDTEIPQLETAITGCRQRLTELSDEQNKQNTELSAQQRDLAELQDRRAGVLGGKAADEEEARMDKELAEAEKQRDSANKRQQESRQNQQLLETAINNLEQELKGLESSMAQAAEAFQQAISDKGFSDETSFCAARLPETERKKLQEKAAALDKRKTELNSKETTLGEQLDKEEKKELSSEPRADLEERQKTQQADLAEKREGLGTLRNKLDTNDKAKEKHRDKSVALDKQQQSCDKWQSLHDLIGSSDGKVFRNFAQGLTFAIVVRRANEQLKLMSDRYQLIPNEQDPLELDVVDKYQADVIRSSKNLSGGESFIVSLALALGLSNMASKKVRIDSLFLDEGFGALDEESLNSALEALAALRLGGKTIGVISHVAMLKERINTQIQVIPIAEGRSRLAGPGCSLSADDAD